MLIDGDIEIELRRRIHNSLTGVKYGDAAKKIMKIVLTQAFIDGLIIESPGELSLVNPGPITLRGQIKEAVITANFDNK